MAHTPWKNGIFTMAENDANLANYAELGEHIKRLGGKLNGMTKGTDAYEETKEDLEMYYERLHQIEQMRTNTVEAERDEHLEARKKAETAQERAQARLVLVSGCLLLCIAAVIENHIPGAISGPIEWTITTVASSTPIIVIITAALAHIVTRLSHSP